MRERVSDEVVRGACPSPVLHESALNLRERIALDLVDARAALAAERELADKLAEALRGVQEWLDDSEPGHNDNHGPGVVRCAYCEAQAALASWRERRGK